jgi:hypothetical protein
MSLRLNIGMSHLYTSLFCLSVYCLSSTFFSSLPQYRYCRCCVCAIGPPHSAACICRPEVKVEHRVCVCNRQDVVAVPHHFRRVACVLLIFACSLAQYAFQSTSGLAVRPFHFPRLMCTLEFKVEQLDVSFVYISLLFVRIMPYLVPFQFPFSVQMLSLLCMCDWALTQCFLYLWT